MPNFRCTCQHFFFNSANTINEDCKWSRENATAAALTQTDWLFIQIRTLVCFFLLLFFFFQFWVRCQGSGQSWACQEGFSLAGENCHVYTAYTNVCIGLTVGTSSLWTKWPCKDLDRTHTLFYQTHNGLKGVNEQTFKNTCTVSLRGRLLHSSLPRCTIQGHMAPKQTKPPRAYPANLWRPLTPLRSFLPMIRSKINKKSKNRKKKPEVRLAHPERKPGGTEEWSSRYSCCHHRCVFLLVTCSLPSAVASAQCIRASLHGWTGSEAKAAAGWLT